MKREMRTKVFSNRWLYTFIALGIILSIGVGVYATAGTVPNPGHALSELQPCSDGQTIKTIGTSWTCADITTDSNKWGTDGVNIWNLTAKVGLGTSNPTGTIGLVNNGGSISWGASNGNGPYSSIKDNGDLHIFTDDTLHFDIGSKTDLLTLTPSGISVSGSLTVTSGRTAIYKTSSGTLTTDGSCTGAPIYWSCTGGCDQGSPVSTCTNPYYNSGGCGSVCQTCYDTCSDTCCGYTDPANGQCRSTYSCNPHQCNPHQCSCSARGKDCSNNCVTGGGSSTCSNPFGTAPCRYASCSNTFLGYLV